MSIQRLGDDRCLVPPGRVALVVSVSGTGTHTKLGEVNHTLSFDLARRKRLLGWSTERMTQCPWLD